jgi:VWFA-related protein
MRRLICLGMVFSAIGVASAQGLSGTLPDKKGTAAIDRTIQLDVVVAGKPGVAVAGLEQKDFTVLDNKVAQTITSFRAPGGGEEPVRVILVIDGVNSSFQMVAYERGEIDKFLRAQDGELAYPTTLAILTDAGMQIQGGFSRDGNVLSAALDKYEMGLRTITRASTFYGAEERFRISLNGLNLLADHEATQPGRTLIFWISPGWPLISGPGVDLSRKQQQDFFADAVGITSRLRKARITLYDLNPVGAVEDVSREFFYEQFIRGVSRPNDMSIGNLSLQVLALQSGGLVTNTTGVTELLKRYVDDARAYYEVTIEAAPGERPDDYHSLEVKVARQGLAARTITGYYAQP